MIVYNFGDGFTATGGDVFHTYRLPGTYTITETISKYDAANGVFQKSVARKPDAVTVLLKPVTALIAAFSASPESGRVPLRVTFTDESIWKPDLLFV